MGPRRATPRGPHGQGQAVSTALVHRVPLDTSAPICRGRWALGEGERGCMVCRTPGDGVQTTPSAASGQRGPASPAGPLWRPVERAQGGLASGDFLVYNAHPRMEPWQENRLQMCTPSRPDTERRQHRSSYREKFKSFPQVDREVPQAQGHQPGEEGTENF